jgi:hypothetical protein
MITKIDREGVSYISSCLYGKRTQICGLIFGYYFNIILSFKLPLFYIERGIWGKYLIIEKLT